MKKRILIGILFLLCFVCACKGGMKKEPAGIMEQKFHGFPVISIETVLKDEDALTFAMKPVAPHVAKQIASWTPGYVMPPAPYYEGCTITVKNEADEILLKDVKGEVKVRGNWTTSYDKKSFRLKFDDKQSMLGLNGNEAEKNWVLLAEYKDASMLRDLVSFEMAKELLGADGYYSADATLVEVIINGQYWGVYLLAQMQQVGKAQINITKPKDLDDNTQIGYLLEFDGYFMNEDPLNRFHVDYADNAPLVPYDGLGGSDKTITCLYGDKKDVGMTIKSDINSEKQRNYIANFVNNVYRIMYYAAYKNEAYVFTSEDYTTIEKTTSLTPRQAIEAVVDIDSLVDTYILSELTCDADLYWSSFFMDVDFGKNGNRKLTFEAPWDFDSGLGNKNRCVNGNGFYASNIVPDVNGNEYETMNPWLMVLAYEDWYQDLVRARWQRLYETGIFERIYQLIDRVDETYREAFDRNYGLWNNIVNNASFRNELSIPAAQCKTQEQAANFLKNWITGRVWFLNSQWGKE